MRSPGRHGFLENAIEPKGLSGVNLVFFVIVAVAFLVAAGHQLALGTGGAAGTLPLEELAQAALDAAQGAVTLGIELIGAMALFLGLMKVAEAAGLLALLARALRPVLVRLFPEIPAGHPAMGAMVMNVAANMAGLSNAATPFGIRAMQELQSLNRSRPAASDAMVLFLAINTANVTLLPTHVMALRASLGASDPGAVIPTTLLATLGSTAIAILAAKLGSRWFPAEGTGAPAAPEAAVPAASAGLPWRGMLAFLVLGTAMAATVVWGRLVSSWILPGLIAGILAFGVVRKVPVYEIFVKGARDGLFVAIRIIPYLVAILAAVAMLRRSGAMDMLIGPVSALTQPLGLPAEALTMAVLRSLSGSASFGYLASLMKDPAIGPDGYLGLLAGTIYGSSETTFYVLAVYFGSVGIKRIRHALAVGLLADLAGLAISVVVCGLLAGPS